MRRTVGTILVIAAVLKTIDIFLRPEVALANGYSPLLLPILIGSELGLGMLTLSGSYWRPLRLVMVPTFAAFACYSLAMAVRGASTCGCFGALEVSPWWTFLLDVSIVVGLLIENSIQKADDADSTSLAVGKKRFALVCSIISSLALASGLAWYAIPRHEHGNSSFAVVGDLIVLEPEKWDGEEFPLRDYIDLDVSEGVWILLLHRYDCPDCRRAVPLYEDLARTSEEFKVALIEVPPFDGMQVSVHAHCYSTRLRGDQEWFVETPLEIRLNNGLVKAVSHNLLSIRTEAVVVPTEN